MTRPSEVHAIHTAILRCTLVPEDSRSYWAVPDPGSHKGRADRAFSEHWFGARSHARVSILLRNLQHRFDAYPEAARVLRAWTGMDRSTRIAIGHWHLQLSDPLYRAFTGEFLAGRRATERPEITRALATAWVGERVPGRWSMRTRMEFASKLLAAAAEAGIVGSRKDPRPIRLPRVPDDALLYLFHILRGVEFEGTLIENPYLASVGLTGDALIARLRSLPGLHYGRQGAVVDLSFEHESLKSWFAARAAA